MVVVETTYLLDLKLPDFEARLNYLPGFNISFPGGHSELEPPDPIPNSEVKRFSADDSVGLPHVKVGHCQVLIRKPRSLLVTGFLFDWGKAARWPGPDLPYDQAKLTPYLCVSCC